MDTTVSRNYEKHGLTKHPLRNTWTNMRQRCNNPKNTHYSYYGGRGIKVCERWNSFPNFVNDMGDKPSPGHTVDRIDVDKDYSPQNCRWATKTEQVLNTRIRSDNKSGVKGVYWDKSYKRWCATVHKDGVKQYLGWFKDIPSAKKARMVAQNG